MRRSVFLIGPMGSGKSTIGRLLAEALGMTFVDSDQEIERRTGVDIPTIFEYEGEEGFRRRERRAIAELARRPGIVLATGGGAVLAAENRRALRKHGTVVYLQASVASQLARTERDRNRPLLQDTDRRARLDALLAEREPLYRGLADIIISTDGQSPKAVTRRLSRSLTAGAD